MELAEVPARYLADDIVEGRLEECRGLAGDGVLQVEETVAKSELGGHEGQGITGGFRRECRRAAQTGVDLDDAVIHRIGVICVLHITLADDSDVADNLDGELAQIMVVIIGEGLGGSDDD